MVSDSTQMTDPAAYCWACGSTFASFVKYGLPPRPGKCPKCGAKPRHRAMLWYLRQHILPGLGKSASVLEIGPGKFATSFFPQPDVLGTAKYIAVDVRHLKHHQRLVSPHAFVKASASGLCFGDATFDVILCNNTLTYIRDDRSALAEINRCLKSDGVAMLQTHRDTHPTRTAAEHARLNPDLGPEWFAENGDEWVYGPDFFDRVRAAGMCPRIDLPLHDTDAPYRARHGLKDKIELIVAFKSAAGPLRFVADDSHD